MGVKQPLSNQREELRKKIINGLKWEVQCLCNRLVGEVTIDGVEAELEAGNLLKGCLIALGCNINRIGDRCVRNTERRSTGDGTRYVGDGVMNNAVLFERRVLMRGDMVAGLDRTALVDCNIDDDGSFFSWS